MNYCASNFRYKKIEKNVLIKNNNCQSSIQNSTQCPKNTIIHLSSNSYTGKNYSSIKSLVRRLQATGQSKINYPRIKNQNQRTDIFLKGGSINQINKIDLVENTKKTSKAAHFPYKKFTQTKHEWISRSPFQDDENQQVYICRHIPLQYNKQEVYKKSQSVKTEIQKNIYSTNPKHRIKFISQSPALQNADMKNLSQDKINDKSSFKLERAKACLSLKQQPDTPHSQTHKKNIPTRNEANMHQNKSENNIPASSIHSKRVRISKSIVKSKVEFPNQQRNISQLSNDSKKKPLFYLSQDQIRHMNLSAKSFIVMQYPSKQVVTGVYYRQVNQIASLTKIVTLYCCLQLIQKHKLNMDQEILIIDQQAQETSGTSAQLQEGDKFTFRQICYGLMLPSGNDAALALAKWGGRIINKNAQLNDSDLKAFMNYMNTTCQSIGMKLSFFGNPHGLPHPKSGSTAEDVSLIISEALQVIRTKQYRCWIQNKGIARQVIWDNTQKLLRREGFIGVKTGVTVTAGPCLSTCYQVKDKIFIVVLLKASKISRRFKQTRLILAKVLSKLNWNLYRKEIKQIERNDPQLDSDNSEEQQQFNYDRNDAQQMKKRIKILTYQM